jgi:hypothetical protein
MLVCIDDAGSASGLYVQRPFPAGGVEDLLRPGGVEDLLRPAPTHVLSVAEETLEICRRPACIGPARSSGAARCTSKPQLLPGGDYGKNRLGHAAELFADAFVGTSNEGKAYPRRCGLSGGATTTASWRRRGGR